MDTGLKLLLLEDNPEDAELIQHLLKRSGMQFSAQVVSDENEFMNALDKNNFDAVLADNALPQYSSMEALNLIKSRNPYTAFILVTGTVSEEFAVNIIQQGADDYILKSNLARLSSAIKKAIEGRQMQKEKILADIEMQELNKQLRALTAHVQEVREEEQARIAREIHDQLGQMLTAIKMDISSAGKKMGKSELEAKNHLSDALSLVDETIKSVRKIASELRPSLLDDLGLEAALDWQGQEFEKHNPGIIFSFYSSVADVSIEKNIATALYRIYQESLTNIARHSGATKVKAELNHIDDKLVLTITDNGKGFDPAEIKNKKSLGLIVMKERTVMINGEFIMESTPRKGTSIRVIIPV